MKERILKGLKKFSPKTYWKEILAVFIILLAFVFLKANGRN